MEVSGDSFFGIQGLSDEVQQLSPASKATFAVYPNPSSGLVQLQLENDEIRTSEIEIYNTQGQLVRRLITQENSIVFDLTDLQGGLYIIKVRQAGKATQAKRIILKN